jgi:hypothetical protein
MKTFKSFAEFGEALKKESKEFREEISKIELHRKKTRDSKITKIKNLEQIKHK